MRCGPYTVIFLNIYLENTFTIVEAVKAKNTQLSETCQVDKNGKSDGLCLIDDGESRPNLTRTKRNKHDYYEEQSRRHDHRSRKVASSSGYRKQGRGFKEIVESLLDLPIQSTKHQHRTRTTTTTENATMAAFGFLKFRLESTLNDTQDKLDKLSSLISNVPPSRAKVPQESEEDQDNTESENDSQADSPEGDDDIPLKPDKERQTVTKPKKDRQKTAPKIEREEQIQIAAKTEIEEQTAPIFERETIKAPTEREKKPAPVVEKERQVVPMTVEPPPFSGDLEETVKTEPPSTESPRVPKPTKDKSSFIQRANRPNSGPKRPDNNVPKGPDNESPNVPDDGVVRRPDDEWNDPENRPNDGPQEPDMGSPIRPAGSWRVRPSYSGGGVAWKSRNDWPRRPVGDRPRWLHRPGWFQGNRPRWFPGDRHRRPPDDWPPRPPGGDWPHRPHFQNGPGPQGPHGPQGDHLRWIHGGRPRWPHGIKPSWHGQGKPGVLSNGSFQHWLHFLDAPGGVPETPGIHQAYNRPNRPDAPNRPYFPNKLAGPARENTRVSTGPMVIRPKRPVMPRPVDPPDANTEGTLGYREGWPAGEEQTAQPEVTENYAEYGSRPAEYANYEDGGDEYGRERPPDEQNVDNPEPPDEQNVDNPEPPDEQNVEKPEDVTSEPVEVASEVNEDTRDDLVRVGDMPAAAQSSSGDKLKQNARVVIEGSLGFS